MSVSTVNPLRVMVVVAASLATVLGLALLRAELVVDSSLMGLSLLMAFGAAATLGWWYVFLGHRALSRRRMACSALGGVALGGFAFLGGFFGAGLFMPESNLAPLTGVFITGPLGFALGVAAGWIWSLVRVRPSPA